MSQNQYLNICNTLSFISKSVTVIAGNFKLLQDYKLLYDSKICLSKIRLIYIRVCLTASSSQTNIIKIINIHLFIIHVHI